MEQTAALSRLLTARSAYAVVFLTALLLIAFPAAANTGARATTVMVFGDSLSAAYGMRAEQGWVALLATRLAARGVNVVNASISGETTSGGLRRIKTDLERHQPAVVVVALGANDGLRGLPVANTRQNLLRMLELIKQHNAQAVLVGIQIPPNYGIQYADEFKNLYAKLAAERKLPLVPFLLEGIADNLDNFQPDRLHPTASTQLRVLQNVLPMVERALPRATLTSSAKGTP